MSASDAERWNARYREEMRYSSFERPRPFLVENSSYLPTSGLALDVAMGLGGNAGYLIDHGLSVVGVDISSVALRHARRRLPSLMAVQADLTRFNFPVDTFDIILNFYYLQRDLWPQYVRLLRPRGFLVFETLTQDFRTIQPDIDPKYLLAPGELSTAFSSLETVVYREGWVSGDKGHDRPVACLLARLPG
jgi:tellurite methyltransferase